MNTQTLGSDDTSIAHMCSISYNLALHMTRNSHAYHTQRKIVGYTVSSANSIRSASMRASISSGIPSRAR